MKALVIVNLVVSVASLAILATASYKALEAKDSMDQIKKDPMGSVLQFLGIRK